jgi:threonine/homoserine/homoserine lactone efflux protein
MPALPPLLVAFVVGYCTGFMVSIPIGPINITIINEGARRGFGNAFLVGFGAVFMDIIYCSVGFAGAAPILDSHQIKAAMELGSFLLVFILGLKYLLAKPACLDGVTPSTIEKKWHPHSAFMLGFARVLGNPGVLLYWITLAATFSAHDVVDGTVASKGACVAGIGFGATTWFLLLSYLVTKLHRSISPKTMVRLSQFSGASLLCLSVFIGYKIVELLAKR